MDAKLFADLVKVQKLILKGDDLMDQDVLFELQELTANVLLKHSDAGQQYVLPKLFPHVYEVSTHA